MTEWQKADSLVKQAQSFLDAEAARAGGGNGLHDRCQNMTRLLQNFISTTRSLQDYISLNSQRNRNHNGNTTIHTRNHSLRRGTSDTNTWAAIASRGGNSSSGGGGGGTGRASALLSPSSGKHSQHFHDSSLCARCRGPLHAPGTPQSCCAVHDDLTYCL